MAGESSPELAGNGTKGPETAQEEYGEKEGKNAMLTMVKTEALAAQFARATRGRMEMLRRRFSALAHCERERGKENGSSRGGGSAHAHPKGARRGGGREGGGNVGAWGGRPVPSMQREREGAVAGGGRRS